ncbi:unnamed protein product [Caenorhabditis sp. 36 PRJEB53466]|nr:unnamed protein product [Caenorhabditis sp. 36 PRJEB53466]
MRVLPASRTWCALLIGLAATLLFSVFLNGAVNTVNDPSRTEPSNDVRFKRDGGWSEYVQKMSTVSCISSGISLLYGLINGHIAMDKAVAELLNFGSVKVSDIAAINKDSVNAWTNDLKAPGLDGTKDALDLEEHTVGLARMKVEMTDRLFGEVPDKATYFSVIDNFVNDPNMDFKNLTDAGKIITNTIKLLNNVTGQPEVTNENYGGFLIFFIKIVKGLTNVEGVVSAASTISSKSTSYNTLKNENHPLIPLANFIYFAEKRTKLPTPLGTAIRSEVIKNLDIVSKLSTQSAKSKSTVSHVNSLLFCRLNPLKNSRKYAPGLVLGLSDLSNLPNATRDHLVEKTVGGGKNFARFGDGFKPVMELTDKLQPVDGKLRKVATQENLASIRKIVEIQRTLEDASVGKQEAEAVFDEFRTIELSKLNLADLEHMKKLMEEVNNLRNAFSSIDTFASKSMTFDGLNQLKEMASVSASLQVSDLPKEVAKIVKKLKAAKDTVETVIKSLKAAKEIFERLEQASQAKTLATEIKSKKAKVDGFYDQRDIKTQLTALNNLKNATHPSEKVSKAIQAAQKIRALAPSDVTNFESVVSAVSSVAPTLKNLPTVLEDMKKKQSDVVKDLMGMKGAKDVAEKIGKPTAMVRNMQELQRVDISVLKDVSHVTTALRNVSDLGARAEIEKKWGDHSKDIASIESTLQQINTFKTTVQSAQPKDLREIGAPLASARNVGSLSVTAAAKSDALSILIPFAADPKVLEDLRQKKEKLDELAALDLDFAAYHSSIAAVPLALTSLFDFLTSFLKPKVQSGAAGPGAGAGATAATSAAAVGTVSAALRRAGAETAKDNTVIIVIGVAGAVVLGGLIATGSFFFFRWFKNRIKNVTKIMKWVEENVKFQDINCTEATSRKIVDEIELHYKKMMDAHKVMELRVQEKAAIRSLEMIRFVKKTAVRLPGGGFIHANVVKTKDGTRFIMTQSPQRKNDEDYSRNTYRDFLSLLMSQKPEFVVKLDPTDAYYPRTVGTSRKFGMFTVTLVKEQELAHKCTERTLKIVNTKTGKELVTTQFACTHYSNGVPILEEGPLEIIRKVNGSKQPVVVHCTDGLGRTGSFVAMPFVVSLAKRRPDIPVQDMFVMFAEYRHNVLIKPSQVLYAIFGVNCLLCKEYKKEEEMGLERQRALFTNTLPQFDKHNADANAEADKDYRERNGIEEDDEQEMTNIEN